MPYYSKIDTDNEFKVFDANDKKISGTDIGGLTNPNTIQMTNDGDLMLRDPKNDYNIWKAYADGSGKITPASIVRNNSRCGSMGCVSG